MSRASAKQAKQNVSPMLVQWRFRVVVAVILTVFVGLTVRAAYIQVIAPDVLIKQGDSRTLRTRSTAVHRGLITDRNGQQLAVSVPVQAIWADPSVIEKSNALQDTRRWRALAEVLGQKEKTLKKRVSNADKHFVYIQRQVSPAMANFVKELKIPGIYLRNESRRYYPSGEVSAHLLGFTNVDDDGIEGIEKLYDDWLTGTPGSRKVRLDGKRREVEILKVEDGEEPNDLQLTIDQRLQAIAYKELKTAVRYYKAASGSAIIADVNTGEVLAMVNSPSFNPNNLKNTSAHRIRNRAVTDAFEPGSSVKPLAVLSALEFGAVEVDTIVDTSPGWMRLGGSIVDDPRNYGELDLTSIIRKSSNMGTSKLALAVPKQFLLDLYYDMGLMSDSGSNLMGESSGIFHERNRWSDFELSTLSFGYGLSVTAMQLTRMYTIIGSGGIKRPLSVIKSGEQIPQERVLSEVNARAILTMMESVVQEDGSGKKAKVSGYRIAGKTGTSRKAVAGGYGEEYVNIFAGIAPVSNPQLAIVVLINEPRGELYHAGDTAAPVFSKIMSGALQLLNVPPDDRRVSSIASIAGEDNAG
jgi:cell division protein FtsI (penicillin-binding protein 3)